MGADKREADIVVYSDVEHNKPYIVVECKKEEVSNPEYQQSIAQAFSYAVLHSTTIYGLLCSTSE
jgi:type I restriction enzyme M protein